MSRSATGDGLECVERCFHDAGRRRAGDDDCERDGEEAGGIEVDLCIVDRLAERAGGDADDLGGDTCLPSHAERCAERRFQVRIEAGHDEEPQASSSVDREQLAGFIERGVGCSQSCERVRVHQGQYDKEDDEHG